MDARLIGHIVGRRSSHHRLPLKMIAAMLLRTDSAGNDRRG
jgi:hypothetical protein